MREVKINFVSKRIERAPKRSLFFFGRAFALALAVSAIVASAASFNYARSLPPGDSVLDNIPVVSEIRSFIFADSRSDVTDDGRTNILILGIGGAGHDGPELSDTMLLMTLDRVNHKAGLISVPRDLLVEVPDHGEQKINAANAYGEEKGAGEGAKVAAQVMENIFGTKIQYYLRVDFKAFADAIDIVGGVNVYVDRAFTDTQYPTEDLGFETISFDAGMQHMNGATALKYARSRHGSNGEGSDFARSARQQKMLHAFKQTILSTSTFLSPTTITNLLKNFKSHVTTNMTSLEILTLFREYRDLDQKSIAAHVLVPGDNEPLYETYVNGSYVLLPKNPDWSELKQFAKDIFATKTAETVAIVAPPHVEVQNGTGVSGLARETAGRIARNGFVVAKICNAADKNVTQTVIYDLTKGKRVADLNRLKKILNAEARVPDNKWKYTTEITPTDGVQPVDEHAQPADLDFLIVLGSPTQVSSR